MIGLPLGVLLLVVQPPGMSRDERNHLLRVDQIARGDLVSPLDRTQQATARPDSCLSSVVTGLGVHELHTTWRVGDAAIRERCVRRQRFDVSNVAVNSPITYAPAVAGYMVGRGVSRSAVGGLWGARIGGLLGYLALAWLAVRLAPAGKPFLFAVALLPSALTLAVAVSSDSVPVGLGLLATALVLRLRSSKRGADHPEPGTTRLLVALGSVLLALGMSKNLYAPAALLVLLVPAHRFRTARVRAGYVLATVGAVGVAVALWIVFVVNRVDILLSDYSSSFWARRYFHHHPADLLKAYRQSLISHATFWNHTLPGTIGFYYRGLASPTAPLVVFAAATALLGVAAWANRPLAAPPAADVAGSAGATGTRSDRLSALAAPAVVAAVWLGVLALVVYGELLTFTPFVLDGNFTVGFIEGRFFLPVVPFAMLLWPPRPAGVATVPSWARRLVIAGTIALSSWSVLHIVSLYY